MPKRLALIVSAIALTFAACGGDDPAPETTSAAQGDETQLQKGVTLTLWTMPNSPQPKEDLQKMVAPFTAKTGVKVDVQEVGWDVQFDRIRNAAVAGEGPDITQAGTTQVPFFAALGGFTDLSDRVEEIGGKAAYAEGIWNTTQVQGQDGTWAVPWFTEARSIYYRKDVLEKAGVDPATAFKDLASFKATLQAIKDKVPDIEPFGAPGKKAYDLVHQVMPFVWDNGGAELSDDAKQSTINTAEAQQGV
jgi:multiple sugar transport system substrate-binding protein